MVNVAVYAEGHTEWYVARKLKEKEILDGAGFYREGEAAGDMIMGGIPKFKKKLLDPSGRTGILITCPTDRILLMFDQEQCISPDEAKSDMGMEMRLQELGIGFNFSQHADFQNVFIGEIYMKHRTLSVAIHVADKKGPDGNRDFDGYIVELLQGPVGVSIVEGMLKKEHQKKAEVVHKIGEQRIPELMKDDQWPIERSKTILYSHITATQFGKPHTFFSQDVVEKSDKQDLLSVFASLIAAWDALKKEDGV